MNVSVLLAASLGNAALAACCGYALGRGRRAKVTTPSGLPTVDAATTRVIEALDADAEEAAEDLDEFVRSAGGRNADVALPLRRSIRRYARRLEATREYFASDGGNVARGDAPATEDRLRRRVGGGVAMHHARVTAFLDSLEAALGRPAEAGDAAAVLIDAADSLASDARALRAELARAKASLGELAAELSSARLEARVDPLTKLANRRAFDERLAECRSRLDRGGTPYAVAVFDVDRFKRLNDEHGHAAGDAALQVFARLLAEAVRPYDTAARLGGEEFALLLPGTDLAGAAAAAERVRRRAEQAKVLRDGGRITFTVSGGVAAGRTGDPAGEPLGRADDALYAAKAGGRNRIGTEEAGNEASATPLPQGCELAGSL